MIHFNPTYTKPSATLTAKKRKVTVIETVSTSTDGEGEVFHPVLPQTFQSRRRGDRRKHNLQPAIDFRVSSDRRANAAQPIISVHA